MSVNIWNWTPSPIDLRQPCPTFAKTHSGAEDHYAMKPDDKRVIDAFISRLAARNIRVSPDPESPKIQNSELPQTKVSSVAELTFPAASCAKDDCADASSVVSPSPREILIPDLDDQQSTLTTASTAPASTNMSADREQKAKPKGLFASKWGLDTLDPSKWDPSSTSSSFSKIDTSKASWSNTSSPLTSPAATHQHNPTQLLSDKKNKQRVADSFQLLKPSQNSIYADWSPEQEARERQETLDRGIQKTREARIKELEEELASLRSPPAEPPSTRQPLRDSCNSKQPVMETPVRNKSLPLQDSSNSKQSSVLEIPATKKSLLPPNSFNSKQSAMETLATKQSLSEAPSQNSYSEEELLHIATTCNPQSANSTNLVRATALKDDIDPTVASLFQKLDLVNSRKVATSSPSSQPGIKPRLVAQTLDLSSSNFKVGAPAGQLPSSIASKAISTSGSQAEKHPDRNKASDSQPEANSGTWTKFAQKEQEKSAQTSTSADHAHLEGQLFFNAYPKPEKREGSPSERRKVLLTNLPEDSKPSSITSIVYGGPLELMHYVQGSTSAYVIFLHGKDALRFYDETANGIPCATDTLRSIWVELDEQPVPHSSRIKESIEKGFTRSVRMVGISRETSLADVASLALGSKMERKVASIAAKKMSSGAFAAEIHFCSIKDAYSFKAFMNSNEDWEHCNIQFIADPCADNQGSS